MTRYAWAAVGLALVTLAGTAAQPDPQPEPESGILPAFIDRSGASRDRAIKEGGGSEATLIGTAKALAWLARQQKPGGAWHFPDKEHADPVGATGLTLLPFLGVGQTNRSGKYGKYTSDALAFLTGRFDETTGTFGPDTSPAGHALATAAVCETWGMTRDQKLLPVSRGAIRHLVSLQRPDGGWAEEAGKESTFVGTGWAMLAIRAAHMARIPFPDSSVKKLMEFLNARGAGPLKSQYGEPKAADARPGTTPTAIGLTGRYLFDGWGPNNAGLADGTIGMFGEPKAKATQTVTATDRSRAPKTWEQVKEDRAPPDPPRAFYATRVAFAFGGPEWQEWNEGSKDDAGRRLGGMRDWLTMSQSANGNDSGSWDAPPGFSWGRLGATALHALTLEVYYRDPPLYRRLPAP